MVESEEKNCILGVIKRSKVFIRVTTKVSQTAGEAPLPWPVPNNGECGVPWYVSCEMLYAVLTEYFICSRQVACVLIEFSGKPHLRAASMPRATMIRS